MMLKTLSVVAAASVLLLGPGMRPSAAQSVGERSNERGNIVIADQFNNRVIEIDPPSHRIVWQYGNGSSVAGPGTIVAPNDAERFGDFTLIAGTGAPAGSEPSCGPPNGCVDNRVILVDHRGRTVWQYGNAGVTGAGFNQLNVPVQATYLPERHVLITDQANERVIEVTRSHRIVWQYGVTGVAGDRPGMLNNPNSAELLSNGHVLIADENNNRVLEVDRNHHIVWQYGTRSAPATLNGAAFASRLPDGHTLITDSNNNRIIEIDAAKRIVWQYATNARPGSIAQPLPTRAVRLREGATLISDQFNQQVIAVDRYGRLLFAQGAIAQSGAGFNHLNGPYDAKVVGDFTGLTPPDLDDRVAQSAVVAD